MKKQIYEKVSNTEILNTTITAAELNKLLTADPVRGSDFVDIDYGDSTTIVSIYKYRDETDEEETKRLEEARRIRETYDKINTTVLLNKQEYEDLKEKAWKYDQLSK